jgi:hypothetical protein
MNSQSKESVITQEKAIMDEKAYWEGCFRSKAREAGERIASWYQSNK